METTPLQLLNAADFRPLSPAMVLAAFGIGVLLLDLIMGRRARGALSIVSLAGLIISWMTLVLMVGPPTEPAYAFYETLRMDGLVFLAQNIILAVAAFLVAISPGYLANRSIARGEYYALMLFSTMAMMMLASSNELLVLFVNLEMLSFTLYILAGIEKKNLRSTEAAFKYFLIGSYAGAFFLFGLTLIYGVVGDTRFGEIATRLADGNLQGVIVNPMILVAGFLMMLVGFGFKLTLAPFHMYAPDVYAGAPTPVAGLIATGSKVAGIVAFYQVFSLIGLWEGLPAGFHYALVAVTVASILIGNVGAVIQSHMKRLLAYSGVAHSGYVLIPIVAAMTHPELIGETREAIAYYLLAYALMTLLAFGVATTLGPHGDKLDRYSGLARRSPFLAGVLSLALISLTGVPITVGFVGKFFLFSVAVKGELYALAIFGVLASVASAYYYLRVIVKMYMEEAPGGVGEPVAVESSNLVVLLLGSVGVFVFAIFPAWISLP